MSGFPARAAAIRLAVFDVDGVLTDGGLLLGPAGEEYKVFHVHDGLGLVMLRESGFKVAVISSRSAPVVAERMAALGIEHVFQGRDDKRAVLLELAERLGVEPADVAYVGDDLADLPAMAAAGLPIAVADAHPRVRERAQWVTRKPGGRGAVREVCEMLLEAQQLLEARIARWLGA
jgi:3-deoxy-D-manno-octulosonate 8-phosphate phosphatase (KDO 8-P phosphatase)